MSDSVQERVEKIVYEDFYGGPLSGSKERLAKALIREFGLSALTEPVEWVQEAVSAAYQEGYAAALLEKQADG